MRAQIGSTRGIDGRGSLGILDVEDRLTGLDKGGKRLALRELGALLVDGKVDKVEHLGDDATGVFQANGHVVRASLGVQELEIVDRVLGREIEPIVVLLYP